MLNDGDVIEYEYLWHWQAEEGRVNGEKNRPTCLLLTTVRDGLTHIFLVPISSTPPQPDQRAIEIPELERKRAGIMDNPSWVRVHEFNYDVAEHSYVLDRSRPRRGSFSEAFLQKIRVAFMEEIKAKSNLKVDRTA